MKEQLRVSREILARLPKQIQKSEEPTPKSGEVKIPDHKEPEKKISAVKNVKIS